MSRRRLLRVVTITVLAAVATSVSAASGKPPDQAPGQSAPVNTSPPSISGVTAQSQTLTASAGTWNGPTPVYAFQWDRCNSTGSACSTIASATGSSYSPAAADVGSTLLVAVTASNKNGS